MARNPFLKVFIHVCNCDVAGKFLRAGSIKLKVEIDKEPREIDKNKTNIFLYRVLVFLLTVFDLVLQN